MLRRSPPQREFVEPRWALEKLQRVTLSGREGGEERRKEDTGRRREMNIMSMQNALVSGRLTKLGHFKRTSPA